jgi:hypothetical protein
MAHDGRTRMIAEQNAEPGRRRMEGTMNSSRPRTDDRQTVADDLDTEAHRLAANDNETLAKAAETDEADTEAHRLAANDNETLAEAAETDEADTEAHRLATNDNETLDTEAHRLASNDNETVQDDR